MRFAVDTGGTFTDLVIEGEDGVLGIYKSPTTPANPVDGVLRVFEVAASALGPDVTARALLNPAGEQVGLVPLALAVAEQHQGSGHAVILPDAVRRSAAARSATARRGPAARARAAATGSGPGVRRPTGRRRRGRRCRATASSQPAHDRADVGGQHLGEPQLDGADQQRIGQRGGGDHAHQGPRPALRLGSASAIAVHANRGSGGRRSGDGGRSGAGRRRPSSAPAARPTRRPRRPLQLLARCAWP